MGSSGYLLEHVIPVFKVVPGAPWFIPSQSLIYGALFPQDCMKKPTSSNSGEWFSHLHVRDTVKLKYSISRSYLQMEWLDDTIWSKRAEIEVGWPFALLPAFTTDQKQDLQPTAWGFEGRAEWTAEISASMLQSAGPRPATSCLLSSHYRRSTQPICLHSQHQTI